MTTYTDEHLELLWEELSDVAFDETDDGYLVLANDWYIFDSGTDREEIWHWFDKHHSKGVYSLMFPNAN